MAPAFPEAPSPAPASPHKGRFGRKLPTSPSFCLGLRSVCEAHLWTCWRRWLSRSRTQLISQQGERCQPFPHHPGGKEHRMPRLQDEFFWGDGPGNPTSGVQELCLTLRVAMILDVISKIFLHFLFQALSLRTPGAVSHAARPPALSLQNPCRRDGGAWI